MERTIRVTGKSRLSVRPDTTRITVTLSEVLPEYEQTVRESSEKKGFLTESLTQLGFDRSDLKTLGFNISPEYESCQDKDGQWVNRLKGYRYNHVMKLEFPVDNEMLGKVFFRLAHCPGEPEFRLQYTLKEPELMKNRLIAQAVGDAKEKAGVLAEAAGVSLGTIQTIDYSWGKSELVSRAYEPIMLKSRALNSAAEESYDMNIEADDIDIEDTVTVVWSIA